MNRRFRSIHRFFSKAAIDVSTDVKNALNNCRPVIALESAVITHGLPYPHNVNTALEMEDIIRDHGIVPATIAVIDGQVKVGLAPEQINLLGTPSEKKTVKVSRRDFPYVLSQGLNGGTTVAGTLVIAKSLGIKIFVTGGIGGVHINGENSLDISADLLELSKCPIMVVSAGIKSILDIGRTLEYLETVGVCVASYNSNGEFPAFYTKKSGYKTIYDAKSPFEAARLLKNCQITGSGVLLAVPVPIEKINKEDIDLAIQSTLQICNEKGISGKHVTPFVLSEVSKVTAGLSMETNILLLKNNAIVGSKIAKEYYSKNVDKIYEKMNSPAILKEKKRNSPVVIGGSNVDYVLQVKEDLKLDGRMLDGDMKRVSGGVGRNIADALSLFGHHVCFMSAIGADFDGNLIRSSLGHVNTDRIVTTDQCSTAWCVVLHSHMGDCMACIGDMSCHQQITVDVIKRNLDSLYQSPLVLMDGNLSEETMGFVIEFCNAENIPVYFEPTDIAVAAKPFRTDKWRGLSFISPNLKELHLIADALQDDEERTSSPINFSVKGDGGTVLCADTMNSLKDVVSKLILHIPVIMVTLGDKGLLMVSRQPDDTISMSHYPPPEQLQPVSVSGAGDCLCAGFISGILQGKSQDESITMGLNAATSALMSNSPVPTKFKM